MSDEKPVLKVEVVTEQTTEQRLGHIEDKLDKLRETIDENHKKLHDAIMLLKTSLCNDSNATK